VGAATGILDQSAALLATQGTALFIDCRSRSSVPVDLGLDASDLAILVVDTGRRHEHVSGRYAARRASCEKAAQELDVPALRDVTIDQLLNARDRLGDETFRRARHVVTENLRVQDAVAALHGKDLPRVGELMSASHRSMKDDFEISTGALDLAVDVSMASGALGARMTGGGFGGSAIALVPATLAPRLRQAIATAFRKRECSQPQIFAVRPSECARRDA
jgi:galactokinase